MSETHDLILYDRSRVTTDWTCPRKRWWQYEFDGKGIVNDSTSLPLYMGTTLHDALAVIATMQKDSGQVDIDLVAETAREQMLSSLLEKAEGQEDIDFAHEQASLVEGMLRGFYKHAWARLMSEYPTILHIEKEMTYNHDGLTFMSKPDLVVADREGNIWYIEYKSTSSKKSNWVDSWATAVQLHSTVKAIEQTTSEAPLGVIVQGLYKGYESYGKQNSVMCYAFQRLGTPPFSNNELRYDYKPGFKRTPVWEMPGGVKGWLDAMPTDLLGDQFPQTPPIFINDDLVKSFFRQRAGREQEIAMVNRMIEAADAEAKGFLLDAAYQQRFDQCVPYFGAPCSYLKLCHGDATDPLTKGFIYRTPHHEAEVEQDASSEEGA